MAAETRIDGIHHITMVASDAARTVRFYVETLGLRLVKRTVNFDDPASHHLYFGDDVGSPGTLLTFFVWPGARGRIGIGSTHHLALCVATPEAQDKWKRWLADRGLRVSGPYDRTYFRSIYFQDPDGLILEIATRGPGFAADEPPDQLGRRLVQPRPELLATGRDEAAIAATTWPEPVAAITPDMRLQGMHHITAIASDIERTTAFYEQVLGLPVVKKTVNYDVPTAPHYYYGVDGGRPGTVITYFGYPSGSMPRGQMGVGLTHHFAFSVADDEAQRAWRERLLAAGQMVSPVLDRQYFKSIYFRDPDGHILEIATAGPGFLVDEPVERLGQELRLPPWLEADRAEIAAALPAF